MKNRKNKFSPIVLPESKVLKAIEKYFAFDKDIMLRRRNVGGAMKGNRFIKFGNAGESDLWGIVKCVKCPRCGEMLGEGVHVEIEVKRYKGKLSPLQCDYLRKVYNMGGIAILAEPLPSPEDPSGIDTMLNKLDWKLKFKMCHVCKKELRIKDE